MSPSRPSALRTLVATMTGNAFLVVASLVLGGLAVLGGWSRHRGRWVYRVARWWSRGLLATSGLPCEASFAVELDPRERWVFMANHQSLYDIPALIATLPVEARFVAKRSLFQIPLFGWGLRVGGFVPVDRRDRSRAKDAVELARCRLDEGAAIVIFPEETRSRDGSLLAFRRGGFVLALRAGARIVPVGIEGTREARPRGGLLIRPGEVRVRYGEPVDPAEYGLRRKRELVAAVRSRVAELAGLPPQAPSADEDAGGIVGNL